MAPRLPYLATDVANRAWRSKDPPTNEIDQKHGLDKAYLSTKMAKSTQRRKHIISKDSRLLSTTH